MNPRTVQHSSFTIERTYPAALARVFRAWTDAEAKARWFFGPNEWQAKVRELDFRPGGRERVVGAFPGGRTSLFDALSQAIVPDKRIAYGYDLSVNAQKISLSLAPSEFLPAGSGTRLIFTEQGAFLDGYDRPQDREEGTRILLDQLGASLTGG